MVWAAMSKSAWRLLVLICCLSWLATLTAVWSRSRIAKPLNSSCVSLRCCSGEQKSWWFGFEQPFDSASELFSEDDDREQDFTDRHSFDVFVEHRMFGAVVPEDVGIPEIGH